LCAYSPCFRAERMASGQENKGLIRLHQFHKVELVKIIEPDHSYTELKKMLADARNILHLLKIPHRVIELCLSELGFTAAKTYDIEANFKESTDEFRFKVKDKDRVGHIDYRDTRMIIDIEEENLNDYPAFKLGEEYIVDLRDIRWTHQWNGNTGDITYRVYQDPNGKKVIRKVGEASVPKKSSDQKEAKKLEELRKQARERINAALNEDPVVFMKLEIIVLTEIEKKRNAKKGKRKREDEKGEDIHDNNKKPKLDDEDKKNYEGFLKNGILNEVEDNKLKSGLEVIFNIKIIIMDIIRFEVKGKQYLYLPKKKEQIFRIDYQKNTKKDDEIFFDKVLQIDNEFGQPYLASKLEPKLPVRLRGKVVKHGQNKKIVGFRAQYTEVKILEVETGNIAGNQAEGVAGEQKELRKKKLVNFSQNPFQQNKFVRTNNIGEIIQLFSQFNKEELAEKKEKVSVAGRILRIRSFGNLIFANLVDQTGTIQLKVSKNKDFAELDIGDIIGVKGFICKTDKGELSIEVKEFILLSKCLRPLPDIHYGFNDVEERFRKRYLDFIINSEQREILVIRHKIVKNIRQFLDQREFIEIETPILVSEASGAQAKPFITRHNKLHRDFYLRIATEIPLKKLIVGGFEKIYEIGRIFRNEGIDARHNPEFTTIEVYQAYENAEHMMNLTEELLHYLVEKVFHEQTEFAFNFYNISLKKPFRRLSMIEAIREHANVDFAKISNLEEACQLAQKYNLKLEKFQKTTGHIVLAFFEEYVEKKLIQPTFIYDYPVEVSPLAKSKPGEEKIADRFELYIGGVEFANGYSELNDPTEQKRRFEEQSKQKELGNEEIASFDKEFLEALEYGMPPAGGLGIGIDRLIMLFVGKNSIKEVIAFPQLKSKNLKDLKIEELEGRENELLFNEGKPFPLPHGPKKRIPDSLAFSEKLGKRLYIFEYKSRIDKGVIDQTIKYRNALQENNDNLNHLRDYWTKTGWTTRDFKHKARIICIAPQFDDDTKERESKQEEIYLVEMSVYNLKNEQLVLLKGKHEEIINLEEEQTIDKIINNTPVLTKEQGISLLFSTKYNPKLTEEVKK
ncbi:7888_t:CDS:2, partial [Cetraspora pellucida]